MELGFGLQLCDIDRDTWVIECDFSLQAGGAYSPAGYYSTTYTTATKVISESDINVIMITHDDALTTLL